MSEKNWRSGKRGYPPPIQDLHDLGHKRQKKVWKWPNLSRPPLSVKFHTFFFLSEKVPNAKREQSVIFIFYQFEFFPNVYISMVRCFSDKLNGANDYNYNMIKVSCQCSHSSICPKTVKYNSHPVRIANQPL